ncbi:hypothetical protein BH23ACT9_BH23ACT9_06210 [soil metagenome]
MAPGDRLRWININAEPVFECVRHGPRPATPCCCPEALQTLPVSIVKIDRSFLSAVVTDGRQRPYTQGYFFGRPMSLDLPDS